MHADETKGVLGRSALMNIENERFDMVADSPVEYMHVVCIGVVKRLVELTFNVGEKRTRVTKRKLSSAASFNVFLLETKVPQEFPRRTRELDFAVMKATEFRNIILFHFINVIQCIEVSAKERTVWLLLAFSIRACILPSKEFQPIPLETIDFACEQFYILYEKLFGCWNCTYSTHVVSSHLIEMRFCGPLTCTSAFPFENFYGEMRHAFTPGTQSPLKQIFEKILIKRALSHHNCKDRIFFSNKNTSLQCNNLVYSYESNKHNIYEVIDVNEETLACLKYETLCTFPEVSPKLQWNQVGVYKIGGKETEQKIIQKEKIDGKVLKIAEYFVTCPTSILNEK